MPLVHFNGLYRRIYRLPRILQKGPCLHDVLCIGTKGTIRLVRGCAEVTRIDVCLKIKACLYIAGLDLELPRGRGMILNTTVSSWPAVFVLAVLGSKRCCAE